jgi:hypothetical protein
MQSLLANYFAAACNPGSGVPAIIPTWYKYLEGTTTAQGCRINIDYQADPTGTIVAILLGVFDIMLFLAGILAVGFIIYGGFQYLISQGEPDKAKNARTTIVNALVGLAITMTGSGIVAFIGRSL